MFQTLNVGPQKLIRIRHIMELSLAMFHLTNPILGVWFKCWPDRTMKTVQPPKFGGWCRAIRPANARAVSWSF